MRDAPITDSDRTAATASSQPPPDREPASPISAEVCPHCERGTTKHRFAAAELFVTTHHCIEHGDVIPRRAV